MQEINNLREFLYGFADFITVTDIALCSLQKPCLKDKDNYLLQCLMEKAISQGKKFIDLVTKLEQLLK